MKLNEHSYSQDLSKIELIYEDASGENHIQLLADVPEVGTLVDPETDDDMLMVGWRIVQIKK